MFNLEFLIGGAASLLRKHEAIQNQELSDSIVSDEIKAAEREVPPGFFDEVPYIPKRMKAYIKNADARTMKSLGVIKQESVKLQKQVDSNKVVKEDTVDNVINDFDFNMEDLL